MTGTCVITTCNTCGQITECKRGGDPVPTTEAKDCQHCDATTDQQVHILPSLSTCKGCCDCGGPDVLMAVRG